MSDIRYLQKKEVRKLLKGCKKPRDHLLISLLWETGLRISEALAMTYEDVALASDAIFVDRGEGTWFPISDALAKDLRKFMDDKTVKLFDITPQRAWQILKVASGKAGLGKVCPQTLRHSYAMHELKKGTDLATVQRVMGHKHIATTAKYLSLL